MKNATLAPCPEREPECDNSDPALFDRCKVTKAPKLFDQDLPAIEDLPFSRSEPTESPIPFPAKNACGPLGTPDGGVVQRYRGGKGYKPIYEPWSPEGLLRVRGRLMAVLKPTAVGGRSVSWADHPLGWGAIEPVLPAPYVLRQVINLALDSTDVCGSDVPGAAELVERTLRANRLGGLDLGLGPKIERG